MYAYLISVKNDLKSSFFKKLNIVLVLPCSFVYVCGVSTSGGSEYNETFLVFKTVSIASSKASFVPKSPRTTYRIVIIIS